MDPTPAKVQRSAEDEQGLRHMHRVRQHPHTAQASVSCSALRPLTLAYPHTLRRRASLTPRSTSRPVTSLTHRPTCTARGRGPCIALQWGLQVTPPQPELGIGAKVMEAAKSALGMGTGPSSEKAE
jgi:hypothetical protein